MANSSVSIAFKAHCTLATPCNGAVISRLVEEGIYTSSGVTDATGNHTLSYNAATALGWRARIPLREGLAAAYADFLAGGGRFRNE